MAPSSVPKSSSNTCLGNLVEWFQKRTVSINTLTCTSSADLQWALMVASPWTQFLQYSLGCVLTSPLLPQWLLHHPENHIYFLSNEVQISVIGGGFFPWILYYILWSGVFSQYLWFLRSLEVSTSYEHPHPLLQLMIFHSELFLFEFLCGFCYFEPWLLNKWIGHEYNKWMDRYIIIYIKNCILLYRQQ